MRRWLLLLLFACTDGPSGPRFDTVPAERGTIISKITATGTLSALVTVQVGSQVSGRIKELNADFNSTVKKGEVLARLDPQLFDAAINQARANHAAAKANVSKAIVQAKDAARQSERTKSLADRKFIAAADAETSLANMEVMQAGVEAARAALAQSEAALEQAQVNLGYTTIVSPIDGVVISRSVDVGQTVAASLQAPILFTIAEDLRRMQVDTSVAEADVGRLSPGMAATFNVDAYPGEPFKGTVRQIRNAAQMVSNVVTYDAVIDVANEELKLKPGMTANVTFVVAEKKDALKVPNAALRFRPPGEKGEMEGRAVYVLDGETPRRVQVQVGVSDGRFTEITSGELEENAAVITTMLEAGGRGRRPPGFL